MRSGPQTDAALNGVEAGMMAECVEVIPDLDQDEISFTMVAGLFEEVQGQIDFSEAFVGDDKGH